MLKFRVYGVPAPQGSKNARVGKDGRAHMYEQSAKTLKPWREEISDAGAKAMDGCDVFDGPLFANITFFMKRPAKPKFPDYPAVRPDVDKMTRGVLDALKMAHVIEDDARIVACMATKVFAASPEEQGALITVGHFAEINHWSASNGHSYNVG
jgi:Holliday junction resolvase RusA-like endonuclease